MVKFFRRYGIYLAWLIALVATLISLFTSEVFNIPVCHLCWYQRIFIYPLTIILGIAAFYEDRKIIKYALPLVILAFIFALYQYLEQMVPGFAPIQLCGLGPSCSQIHFLFLGFITYPFISMLASIAIAIFLIFSWEMREK